MKTLTLVALAFSLAVGPLRADDSKPGDTSKPEQGKDATAEKKDDKPKEVTPKESKGSVKIAGTDVSYAAKTGTLPLLKEDGAPRADVFFVYYARTGADGKPLAATDSARPIIFCFNGV